MAHSVLIVEDDAAIRNGLAALLGIGGHRTLAAASVAEAGSHLVAATLTHLLLDLNLPDGTGVDVLRHVRTQAVPVRVALLTGASDTALLEEARALGVDAVFVKPPDWDEVLEWVAGP